MANTQDALNKIEKAFAIVDALCDGRQRWTMSVPPRPDEDPDLVIARALKAAKEVIGTLQPTEQPEINWKEKFEASEMKLGAISALYKQAQVPLRKWHEKARSLGYDGVNDALQTMSEQPEAAQDERIADAFAAERKGDTFRDTEEHLCASDYFKAGWQAAKRDAAQAPQERAAVTDAFDDFAKRAIGTVALYSEVRAKELADDYRALLSLSAQSSEQKG